MMAKINDNLAIKIVFFAMGKLKVKLLVLPYTLVLFMM